MSRCCPGSPSASGRAGGAEVPGGGGAPSAAIGTAPEQMGLLPPPVRRSTLKPTAMPTMEISYRGYRLRPVATRGGWGVLLGDPAGHAADVCLHQQQGHSGWPSLEEAERAARDSIDTLLAHDDSY